KGLVFYGRIGRTHGLCGNLVVRSSGLLLAEDVVMPVGFFDAQSVPYPPATVHRGMIKFVDCDDLCSARQLVGRELFVAESSIRPESRHARFYSLVGVEVLFRSAPYGTLVGCFDFGAGVVAHIMRLSGDTVMVPWNNLAVLGDVLELLHFDVV